MVSRTEKQLALMTRLANIARDNIASFVPERAYGRLQDSFRFIVNRDRVIIYSHYYWARWVNDGRRALGPAQGGPYLFFVDPRDDPRIDIDYPKKPGDVKRLTSNQMKAALKRDELIYTAAVGKAAGLHFLEKGIQKTRKEAPEEIRELIRGETRRLLRRGRNKITVVI